MTIYWIGSFAFQRVIDVSSIKDDRICFRSSDLLNIKKIYENRSEMWENVYLHKNVIGIDLLITDGLKDMNIREKLFF